MQGYIKLYRSLLEWDWFQDANTFRVFIYCLLKANHVTKKWQGVEIKPGQFITSYEKIATDLNIGVQSVRTSIKKLNLTGELTNKTTSRYSIITVKNWNRFQETNKQTNNQLTNNQQSTNNQLTTTKNDKNEKNIFVVPKIEEIKKYCEERNNNINALHFFDYYQSKGWMIGKNKMKDWKAAVRTWEQKNKKEKPALKKYNPYYNVYAED